MRIRTSRLSKAVRDSRGAPARRRSHRFRPAPLEQFEDRVVMSVQLLPLGTGTTNGSPVSLNTVVGLVATTPVITPDGKSIAFGFTNNGTQALTLGVATYLDAQTSTPVDLAQEVFEGISTVTVAANGGTTTVLVPLHTCIQVDIFIEQVGSNTVSNYVPAFTSFDDIPASNAGPPIDAGYNVTNYGTTSQTINTHATVANPTPDTSHMLGTLVSFAQTSGPKGLLPDGTNGYPDDCPEAQLSGAVTLTCLGQTEPVVGLTVTLTGTAPGGGTFTLTTTTDASGKYLFSIPDEDLPAHNVTVSVPVQPMDVAGTVTVGTVDGLTSGTGSTSATTEQIAAIGLNFHDSVATGYNFNEQCATTGTVGHGDTATIGFWHNKNGQALLNSLNGGSTQTALGNWLATELPNLYGIGAGSANNLTGKTNADVAAYFLSIFGMSGQAKQAAQTLAAAFAVYVTNSTLAGGTYAAGYGFVVSSQFGTGTLTYDVGNTLAAYGGPTGPTTVLDLLEAFNDAYDGGHTPSAAEVAAYESIFGNINQTGDIS